MAKEQAKEQAPMRQDEEQTFNTLASTFRDVENRALANDVINYIIRQFNEDTMPAILDHTSYKIALYNAINGLYDLVYLKHYSKPLYEHDAVWYSSFNLVLMLFQRVRKGDHNHFTYLIKKLESSRPVVVSATTGGG